MAIIGQTAMINSKSWYTSDLWLAAVLETKGFKLAEAKRSGDRVVFTFTEDEKLVEEVQSIYARQSLVEPFGYKSSINKMRDLAKQCMKIGEK